MVRVLLVGDSLALGLTSPLAAEAKKYGIDLHGDGRTGTTAKQWVTGGWLAKDIADVQPGMTLISLGTNDAMGDLSNFGSEIQTLIDQATSGGGVVGWIGMPSFDPEKTHFPPGNVDKARQILKDTLSARGIQVFPSDAHTFAPRAPDGIHMTPASYAAWASDVAGWAHFPDAVAKPAAAHPSWFGSLSTLGKTGVVVGSVAALGALAWGVSSWEK